uniref:Synaptonemal complex protein 1 n=1 Tax=Xiphophorus maculatus TaxID=8083 RepID=M3ZKL5_XIPMA
MDKDRGFRFKLLVPPRVSHSHINAVRPQGTVGNHLLNSEQQVASSLKQVNFLEIFGWKLIDNSSSGELYSNLFDEVEKIQSWKVKVENDTAEKERRLQDNKRTIETQRKAIQDLQFSNESLSIKLEEQISENEDLRSKNNTTRNLCNILKETFQRSSEKMHLFESEREETHHLFMENSGSIKKLLSAFESLRIRVEADQQEMQKVKKDLLQFEDLKEKYHQEYIMKDKENEMVQKKLENKENELQKALLNLNETQKYCKRLQDSTKQQFELLQSLKTEKESLLQNLKSAEQSCEEFKVLKELEGQLSLEIKKNKECTFQMEQLKEDILQHEWALSSIPNSRGTFITFVFIVNFQNKILKKQIAKETAKSTQLEKTIDKLQRESKDYKTMKEEDYQKMFKDLESKSVLTAELENEVQKLKLTTAEAVKNKEDAELKCQHKIADMVALMEKHKSQYDRMVEEKDMELHKNKKKETEAVARAESLLDLSKQKIENIQLKKQLKTKDTEKSYRIRTPPSNENAGQWGKNTFELDSKSDSSDQIDLFVSIQSPISLKSPGSNLKLAAIKRMRDAGWTAVTNCDKKKKKTSDKIFA